MENIAILMVAVIGLYILFKAVTSAIEMVFKVAIGFLILSFLGYSFININEISTPAMLEPMIDAPALENYTTQEPAQTLAVPEKTSPENPKYL